MISARAAPSDRLVQPLEALGQYTWDMTAPLVLTLEPTGHEPGLYEVGQTFFLRTTPATVSLIGTFGWNQPNFGPTTLAINYGSITPNPSVGALRVIDSSGLGPITVTLTPSGLSGVAALEVACFAHRAAFPVSA